MYLYFPLPMQTLGLPRWCSGKESTCQCRRCRKCGLDPWVGMIPWRRKWWPSLVLLPGKFHRQRSLAGYSPWCYKRVGHDLATKPQQPKPLDNFKKSLAAPGSWVLDEWINCKGSPVCQPTMSHTHPQSCVCGIAHVCNPMTKIVPPDLYLLPVESKHSLF